MILGRPPRSPQLAPLVEWIWVHESESAHRLERLLPTGRMQLLVNLREDSLREDSASIEVARTIRGAGVQGARRGPTIVEAAGHASMCGVSFRPAGAWPFLGVSAGELAGDLCELSDLWGSQALVLRARLLEAPSACERLDILEASLLERVAHAPARDRRVELACQLLADGRSVRDVGETVGLAPARLIDRLRLRTGLSPKRFGRIARFQRVLRALPQGHSWAQTAALHGFADQAHLAREFKTFAGISPTAYQSLSPQHPNHCPLEAEE